jgi:hypothetical protein
VSRAWRSGLPAVPHDAPRALPGLGDQVDDLLEACAPEQVLEAAARLRRTAAGLRRLMAHPHAARVLAVLSEEPGLPGQDPGRVTARLADQAVNLVTALDCLLALPSAPPASSLLLVLEDRPGQDRAEEQARDRLTRRRLDARAAAVREGMRLLAMLPAGVPTVTSPPDGGPAPQDGGAR